MENSENDQKTRTIDVVESQLHQSQRKLFEIYLRTIQRNYEHSGSSVREFILTGLESILDTTAIDTSVEYVEIFNPNIAKIVRKKLNISQLQLANTVGIGQPSVAAYETGRILPNPNSDHNRKYLVWLANNGYNPYQLPLEESKIDEQKDGKLEGEPK